MSKIAELRVETQKPIEKKEFSTTTELKIETENSAERNLKMINSNKTENITDFTNHNGLRIETDRFLAPNCKLLNCNNAHKKLLIFN